MSDKALFVMDMPKDCLHCKMRHVIYCESDKGYQQCGFNRDGYKLESFFNEDDLKDGWISPKCPLKPVPEKKECEYFSTGSQIEAWREGWNTCIDKILEAVAMDNRMKVQEEIRSIKSEMVGSRYRHFKGGIYIVTDIAVHSETEEPMVVYKSFHQPDLVWCRPLDMFLSEVDHEKYPDVKQIKRFERISSDI